MVKKYLIFYNFAAAGLGDLRNDNDANCTYEGENHVLIQQASNWLLKFWPKILKGERISSPLKSIDFFSDGLTILNSKFTANSVDKLIQPESKFFFFPSL